MFAARGYIFYASFASKTETMKNFILLAAAVPLLLCSCSKNNSLSGLGHRTQPKTPEPVRDTSVYVSAVIVPDEYDWHRDTACGAASCSLVLIKDGVPCLSIPTGAAAEVSTDPDTHHLLEGHLYTEFSTSSETVIRCDGHELLRYPGREVLMGLLVDSTGVYTLGRNRDSDGFCFRRNGESLLRQDTGLVFGDFSRSSYGRTGALYRDGGAVCFCFRNSSSCYVVRDGIPSPVSLDFSASRVVDMHFYDSEAYAMADLQFTIIARGPNGSMNLWSTPANRDLEIYRGTDCVWWHGSYSASGGGTICGELGTNRRITFAGNNNFLYHDGDSIFAVGTGQGMLMVQDDKSGIIFGRDSTYLFSRDCAVSCGKELYVLVNPKEHDETPYLWKNGEEQFFVLNGFLTSVEVVVSPSS